MSQVAPTPPLPRKIFLSPNVELPISNELFVLIANDEARLAVIVKSSALALPKLTLPFNVAVPAHVNADIERSFVPSVTPLSMSLKFCVRATHVSFCYIVGLDCISNRSGCPCQSFERFFDWRYGLACFQVLTVIRVMQ
jgi:hypothetical protein